jgi:hypothetical protein
MARESTAKHRQAGEEGENNCVQCLHVDTTEEKAGSKTARFFFVGWRSVVELLKESPESGSPQSEGLSIDVEYIGRIVD